ncbi:hypothetical protein [Agromyces humatus]|uniref:ScoMcrA-like N-terminal head domain-containing protein n=1 Tax=Agromyces humatus TaxID=279573 RepID=A0ABP4WND2_9MICO|nr:hypothetical protein [Agromyces humatus]
MALSDVTDRQSVLDAIEEFDRLGRAAFLEKYGFREAREYFLEFAGERYDSKAIVGAAHFHQHGTALKARDFSGGSATVAKLLDGLGFAVIRVGTSSE